MEKLLSAVPELARIFMISIVVDAAIWLSLAEFHSILLTGASVFAKAQAAELAG